jgi:hypothetical protein
VQKPLPPEIKNDLTQMKLGKEQGNPFSFEVVKKAIEKIKKDKAAARMQAKLNSPNLMLPPDTCSGGGGGTIYPTHTYVRFAPQNVDQLTELEESGMELIDVPLTYEVTEDGDFYQDPSIPEDQITYQYTLVPYGYPLPSHIPYTILDQIYLFNEDDGEALEPDPWTGGGGGGDCPPVPYRTNNQQQTNYLLPVCEYTAQHGDPVIAATQALIDECIQPYEVYRTASEIAGFDEDAAPVTNNNIAARGPRYYPQGNLSVFNTDINAPEPLKGVLVKSRNFMKLGSTYTDASGHFYIDKPYKRKAMIIVKFKNNRATTRGINGVLKVWQYVFPVKHKLGRFEYSGLQTIDYTFPRELNPHSETARKWVAATTMNAVWDTDQFNAQNNIPAFPHLKIWLSSRLTSFASTPMLNYVLAPVIGSPEAIAEYTFVSAGLDQLLLLVPYAGEALVVLKHIIELNKPDVTLRYGDASIAYPLSSRELYNTMIHEFSHATHYWSLVQQSPIGGGSQYWWNNAKYTIIHSGYGNRNDNGAERTAVIEAWGFFAGNTGNAFKYGSGVFVGYQTADDIARDEIRQIENHRRNNNIAVATTAIGTPDERYEGWIPMGLMHDVIDVGEANQTASGITDNVSGYNINGVFRPLRFTNNTVQEYRQQLLNQNSNLQATGVNNLVTQYGF